MSAPRPIASLSAALLVRKGAPRTVRAPIVPRSAPPPVLVERAALAVAVAVAVPQGVRRRAFTLRLDPDRHAALRTLAGARGQSAQRIVTQALDEFLERAGAPTSGDKA